MIKFEHTEVLGWEAAIRGMRNPLESWEKSDTSYCTVDTKGNCRNPKEYLLCEDCDIRDVKIGPNDLNLMMRLQNAGTDHRKFLRMITVYVDITAPLYWWKEFDTYKVGTVANSCSTMHCIQKHEFTLDDFSHEYLDEYEENLQILQNTIDALNINRSVFANGYIGKNYAIPPNVKDYWWQMIQLLPSSYNQKRTVMLNYEVLANIYHSRLHHKLDEWNGEKSGSFCQWIESLPYSQLITGNFE